MISSLLFSTGLVPIFAFYLSFVVTSVTCHGFVHTMSIGGQDYTGYNPFTDPYLSPIPSRVVRKIPSDGPITDVHSGDLTCNAGGETGTSVVAQADPGSNIVFSWSYWPADHQGPVCTYMASCGGDCTTYNTNNSNPQWFKIDAAGYDNGQWAAAKLISNGASWTSTIPAGLAPGQYIIRHEM
jgi:hypothetical protein